MCCDTGESEFYIEFDGSSSAAVEYADGDTVWRCVDAEDAGGLLAVELSYDFTFAV